MNSAARTVILIARLQIRRTRSSAQAAVHAVQKQLVSDSSINSRAVSRAGALCRCGCHVALRTPQGYQIFKAMISVRCSTVTGRASEGNSQTVKKGGLPKNA